MSADRIASLEQANRYLEAKVDEMAARMGELVEHLRHVEMQRDALREMLRKREASVDDISDLF